MGEHGDFVITKELGGGSVEEPVVFVPIDSYIYFPSLFPKENFPKNHRLKSFLEDGAEFEFSREECSKFL